MTYTSYEELLAYATEEADSFSLVWRNVNFDDSAWKLMDDLSPWLVSDYSSSAWPGTELYNDKAKVRTYKLTDETLAILKAQTSVFDWLAPKLPEDLAFYKGKEVLFCSVAHEGEAWFTNNGI